MINLENVLTFHEASEISRHKRLLEEIVFLSLNATFEQNIFSLRENIREHLGDQNYLPPLPVEDKETALAYRRAIYDYNQSEWYLGEQLRIMREHNYFHPSFVRDYPSTGIDQEDRNNLNTLENILFLNDPLGMRTPAEHFSLRPGFMEIEDEPTGPYIKFSFPFGTPKHEIQTMIDKDYDEIRAELRDTYRIPTERFTPDPRLREKSRVYQLHTANQNNTQIAVILERERLVDNEYLGENVRRALDNVVPKINRFDRTVEVVG
jgi:hypothetical protein